MRRDPETRAGALRIIQPIQDFISTERAGGLLLLAATVAALVWANAHSASYADVWGAHLGGDAGGLGLRLTLARWVNDALMAVFFFVVGMEIKREALRGELAGGRKAALPVAAALGGMVVPTAIFLALNAGGDGERGWGIPMATDIAFAVGVLSLLGPRVRLALKVFLLALAIVDDLGAIAVIAIFYTDALSFAWLGAGIALLALTAALVRAGVRSLAVYAGLAVAVWLAVHASGVHATIAGVALGLIVPLGARGADVPSPLERLEQALHPWTSYAIVPIFALANAGVALDADSLGDAARSPVSAGVALGLIAGKPIGIVAFAWLAVRAGVAVLPDGVAWKQIAAVAVVAGIGFTVSLFIAELAYADAGVVAEAKLGILAASAIMGVAGILALRWACGDAPGVSDSIEVRGAT